LQKFNVLAHFFVANPKVFGNNSIKAPTWCMGIGQIEIYFFYMEVFSNGKEKRFVGCSQQNKGLHQEQEDDDI
jgi:hypothetical protein